MTNQTTPASPAITDSAITDSASRLGSHWTKSKVVLALAGLLTTGSVLTAVYFAGVAHEARSNRSVTSGSPWDSLPIANATAAVSSEKFSMATGPVSEQSEALFVLDHNSGLLQCSVLYPRVARFMGTFTANVSDALGMDAKGGGYIMATGTADFPRSSNNPVGLSVVYVLDTGSGNFACYGIPFNHQMMTSNRAQQGAMVLLHQGTANPIVDRDDLR